MKTKEQELKKKYHKIGTNDLGLPQRIMRFIVDNFEKHSGGQGVISISCNKLWEMSEKEFEEIFGVKINSKLKGVDER